MIASETRGSRRTLRSFWRPLAELKMAYWPSKSIQTGVTCGLPSGISVPRLAKARLENKSRYFSGIACGIDRVSGRLDVSIIAGDPSLPQVGFEGRPFTRGAQVP